MAKNRNKKKEKNGAVSMDVAEPTVSDLPQAMDTSESGAQKSAPVTSVRKTKGRPMKRSKNVRKMKAIAKAISKNEITAEKGLKKDGKTTRTQSAKKLPPIGNPIGFLSSFKRVRDEFPIQDFDFVLSYNQPRMTGTEMHNI
ncbi:hypothetical protein NC653_004178 [Populus alba x Populus x berolinensis]|uniref:Uncharacterized protein n=1 Tax=Populus alba x Populus x berolinensis TaxID=444605 RepID=A0AAD6RTD4_9ROSI|nr:hypothetical protein NC653_004178 [Populus alba x Populus x berolinensis]